MNIEDVKAQVEKNYEINIKSIDKIKNVYKINTEEEQLCLKVIKYEFGHFWFILSAIKHLQKNGFEKVPEIIKNIDNEDYICIENNYAYLTKWINAREANYDNPVDIVITTSKMAELHIKSRDFQVTPEMNPRIGWFKWIETYNTRKDEILDFKKRIESKEKKTEFDEIYISVMEDEIERAERAIENLRDSEYLFRMEKEIGKKGFCHHDFAHHNVLIEKENKVNIIDFDYCILDSYLHDLSSLIMRRMKNGKWSLDNALSMINVYDSINPIDNIDIPIIAGFLEFPQDYWQVGIQYYWEKQSWGEEFFVNKLCKIIEDRDMRQEFVDEFRELRI